MSRPFELATNPCWRVIAYHFTPITALNIFLTVTKVTNVTECHQLTKYCINIINGTMTCASLNNLLLI